MSIACNHGQLARSCEICQLEAERDSLRERVAALEAETNRWKGDVASHQRARHKAEERVAALEAELAVFKKEKAENLAEAKRALAAYRDQYGDET